MCLLLSSGRDFLQQPCASAEELRILAGLSLAHRGSDALSRSFKYKLLSGVCDLGGRKVVFRLSVPQRRDSF